MSATDAPFVSASPASLRLSLRTRRLYLLDQLFGYLWGGAIAVEGRDFAASDESAALAVCDRVGEIEGEERAVEIDHQIGGLAVFDYGDVERLKIGPAGQPVFQRLWTQIDRVRRDENTSGGASPIARFLLHGAAAGPVR